MDSNEQKQVINLEQSSKRLRHENIPLHYQCFTRILSVGLAAFFPPCDFSLNMLIPMREEGVVMVILKSEATKLKNKLKTGTTQ